MSGLDPSAKQLGKSEEQGGTSLDQSREGPMITDTSESSQTPSTPRSLNLLTLHTSHIWKSRLSLSQLTFQLPLVCFPLTRSWISFSMWSWRLRMWGMSMGMQSLVFFHVCTSFQSVLLPSDAKEAEVILTMSEEPPKKHLKIYV